MNCNEFIYTNGRTRNKFRRGRGAKAVNIQRPVIGHNYKISNKSKTNTNAVSSNSSIRWKNCTSSNNNVTFTATRSTSSKTFMSDGDSRIIIGNCDVNNIAVAAGRGEANCEIGLAAIDVQQPTLILCQISDMPSFINTLTKINILNPDEILVPMTFVDSANPNHLINVIKEHFRNVTITAVPRLTYNKMNGMQYIKQLCAPEWDSIFFVLQHKYYCLTAASALLTYAESVLYVIYNKKSLKIEYQESEGYCIIDVLTADKLELVACNSVTSNEKYSSLYGIMNYCLTRIGARTLRATILQPPCSVPDIESRLDCITELKRNPNMMMTVQTILPKISNIDQLLSLATLSLEQDNKFTDRHITYVLILNSLLYLLEPLKEAFEDSELPFFKELKTTLDNDSFKELAENVHSMIQPDAHPAKGQRAINEKCFLIKPEINGLLDVLRKTYSERVEDLNEYVKQLGEKYDLPLTLGNNHKKGYHIILQLNAYTKKTFKKSELPTEFIQIERLFSSVTMKTPALMNLSVRIEDIQLEILRVTNIIIYQILVEVRNRIGLFYKLCEVIAKLDMIQALAQASSGIGYIRPEFGDFLEIMNSRHPLLEYLCSSEPTPNSIFASRDHNIHIITGPNGAGKSIYIRQVLLLQVMAQVGCFIPAEKATFRVCDRILSRINFEDNMDCGASTFVLEVKEVQYFHTVMTSNTLIIIDELFRSTAISEGTALAIATIESLAKSQAFIFLATHYIFITKLEEFYPNVTNWQMETIEERKTKRTVLQFTYSLEPGVTTFKKYGLYAATISWPEYIVEEAKRIYNQIEPPKEQTEIRGLHMADRLKYNVEAELKMLKIKKELTWEVQCERILQYVENLKSAGIDVMEYLPKEIGRIDEANVNDHLSASNNDQEIEMNDWENIEPRHLYPEVMYSSSVVNSKLDLEVEVTDYNQFCQELERRDVEYSECNEIGQKNAIFENCLPFEDGKTDFYVGNNDYIITPPSIAQTNYNRFSEDVRGRNVNYLQCNETAQENHTTFEHGLPFNGCESRAYIDDNDDATLSSIISQNINRIIESNRMNRNGDNQSEYLGGIPTLSPNEDYQTPSRSKSLGDSLRVSHLEERNPKSNPLNRPQSNSHLEQSRIPTENSLTWQTLDNSKNIEDPDVTAALEALKECSSYFMDEWDDDVCSNTSANIQGNQNTFSKMIPSKNSFDGEPTNMPRNKSNVIIQSVHIFNQNSELVGVQQFNPDSEEKLKDHVKDNEFFFKGNENLSEKQISPLFGNTFQTHAKIDTFFSTKNEKLDSSNSNIMGKGQCTMSFSGNHSGSIMRSDSLLSGNGNENNVNASAPAQFNLKSDTEKRNCKDYFKNEDAVHKIAESSARRKSPSVIHDFFQVQMKNDLSKAVKDIPRSINDDVYEASNKEQPVARRLEHSEPDDEDKAKNTQQNHNVQSNKKEHVKRFLNHSGSISANNSFFSITDTVEKPVYFTEIQKQNYQDINDDNCGISNKEQNTMEVLANVESISKDSSWFSAVDREGEIGENTNIQNREVDSEKFPRIQFNPNKVRRDENKASVGCEITDFLTQKKTSISKVNLWFSSCNKGTLDFEPRHGEVQMKLNCTNDDQIQDRSYEHSENVGSTTTDKYIDVSVENDLTISKNNSWFSNGDHLKTTEESKTKTIPEFHSKTPNRTIEPVENIFSRDTTGKNGSEILNDNSKTDIENCSKKNVFSFNISTQNRRKVDLELNNGKSLKNNDKMQKESRITDGNETLKKVGDIEGNNGKCSKGSAESNNPGNVDDDNKTQNKTAISEDKTKIDLNSSKWGFFKNEKDKGLNENNEGLRKIESIEATNINLKSSVGSTCSTLKLDFKNSEIGKENHVRNEELNINVNISQKINRNLKQETSVREVDSSASTLLLNSSLNQQYPVDPTTSQSLQCYSKPKQYSPISIDRYFCNNITTRIPHMNEKTTNNCNKNVGIEGEHSSSTKCKNINYGSNVNNTSKSTNIFETPKSVSLFSFSSEENIEEKIASSSRRKKFKTPLKVKDNENSTSESEKTLKTAKREIVPKGKTKKQLRQKTAVKFVPPKALTKKEILDDYEKQRKKILENPDDPDKIEKYINFINNRPSVEQIQAQKYLALVKKTDDGIVVIPASNTKVKRKKVVPLMRKLSATEFDTTLISDKNSKLLENFLQQEDKIDFDKEKPGKLFDFGEYSKQDNFQPHASTFNLCTSHEHDKQNNSLIDNILKKYQ